MIIGERQEMKTQDLKKFKSSSFLVKSNSAISMLLAKLEIANAELSMKLGRNVLINMCGRVKTIESIQAKCRKKGYDATYECAMEKINDIIGVRGVCSFEDDVYRVAEVLSTHQDLKIIKRKDYIQQPKNSGYRSLHLIVEIPIYFRYNVLTVFERQRTARNALFCAVLFCFLRMKEASYETLVQTRRSRRVRSSSRCGAHGGRIYRLSANPILSD